MSHATQGMKRNLIGAVVVIAMCLVGAVPAAAYGDEPTQPNTESTTVQAENDFGEPAENNTDTTATTTNETQSNVAAQSEPQATDQTPHSSVATLPETATKSISLESADALALANKSALPDGVYAFASAVGNNQLLEVAAGSTKDGGNAQTFANNRHSTQRWKVAHDTKGYITFTNVHSGKVLDVTGGYSGANAQQYYVSGSAGQHWIAVSDTDGSLVFHSALNVNLVLDVAGGASRNNTNVQIYRENGSKAQRWTLDDSPFAFGAIETYWDGHASLGQPTANGHIPNGSSYTIQEFSHGAVYMKQNETPRGVIGNLYDAYTSQGGATGRLGYPVADARITGVRAAQHFEHGSLAVIPAGGSSAVNKTVVLNETVSKYWRSQNGTLGWLGWPTIDESQDSANSSAQSFQGGAVYWYANGDSVPSIQSAWKSHNGTSGSLGSSTSDLTVKSGEYYVHTYRFGAIFAKSKTDSSSSVVMDSDIFKYWNGLGGLSSYLGPPTENKQDITTVDGQKAGMQRFKGGVVYTSSKTGTHGVRGDIGIGHSVRGGAKGFLGLPTSEQTSTVRGGVSQQFQHGAMYRKPGAGAYPVSGEFFQRYTAQGAESGDRGFPVSDEYNDRGHMRQDFEHGSYWEGGMPDGQYSHNVIWNGQPNSYYCAPTSGFMIMHTAGRNPSANGTPLTIDAMARYMHTGLPYGTWKADNVNGLNNWVGSSMFVAHDYPSYETTRSEVLRSFETGYAPMVLTYERRGGAHPNGHPNASFGHAMVVDAYNTQNDGVLIADPLATYGGAKKFWYNLASFRNNFMSWTLDSDAPAIVTAR